MKLAATASALNSDKDDSKYFFFLRFLRVPRNALKS